MRICKKCVMPDTFPRASFDENGVCNFCREYEGAAALARARAAHKKKFLRLLKSVKGRHSYDIVMCYSGGKDSSYALSLLKREYGLNPLAYTMDNGFVPDRTYANIRGVCEALGVDHVMLKPRFDVIRKIFNASLKKSLYAPKTLERASTVCTSCTGIVKYSAIRLAMEKGIPLVGFGWTPGQSPVTASILSIPREMLMFMQESLRKPMLKIAGGSVNAYFPDSGAYRGAARVPTIVHPLAFVKYNEKRVLATVKKLGWKRPRGVEMNATNCLLNPLGDQVHMAKYGYHPYTLEIAALVRQGCMTRGEGLRHLPVKKSGKIISYLKKRLK